MSLTLVRSFQGVKWKVSEHGHLTVLYLLPFDLGEGERTDNKEDINKDRFHIFSKGVDSYEGYSLH